MHGTLDDGLDDPAHAMGKNMGGGKNGGNGDFLASSSIYILSVFRTVDFGRRISNEKRACLRKELKEVFAYCSECGIPADHCGFCPPPLIFAAQRGMMPSRFSLGFIDYLCN